MAFPVRLNPITQGGLIQAQFAGNIGDRAGGLYHHPGGFLLELRREIAALLPCHSIPSFPVKILLDPRPEISGHPNLLCGGCYVWVCVCPGPGVWPDWAGDVGRLAGPPAAFVVTGGWCCCELGAGT